MMGGETLAVCLRCGHNGDRVMALLHQELKMIHFHNLYSILYSMIHYNTLYDNMMTQSMMDDWCQRQKYIIIIAK
jgi:hypothetical protein